MAGNPGGERGGVAGLALGGGGVLALVGGGEWQGGGVVALDGERAPDGVQILPRNCVAIFLPAIHSASVFLAKSLIT